MPVSRQRWEQHCISWQSFWKLRESLRVERAWHLSIQLAVFTGVASMVEKNPRCVRDSKAGAARAWRRREICEERCAEERRLCPPDREHCPKGDRGGQGGHKRQSRDPSCGK